MTTKSTFSCTEQLCFGADVPKNSPPSLTRVDILALCRATGEGNRGLKGARTTARAASSFPPTLMPYRFFVVLGGAKGESIFMRGTSFQTWNQNK